jgi:hypothetical protein
MVPIKGQPRQLLFLLTGAVDCARVLAGDVQADTLRVALVYLHDNATTIAAFAASDPQMNEWLVWLITRITQFKEAFEDAHGDNQPPVDHGLNRR